jgi:hypothetical protein
MTEKCYLLLNHAKKGDRRNDREVLPSFEPCQKRRQGDLKKRYGDSKTKYFLVLSPYYPDFHISFSYTAGNKNGKRC